MRYTQVLAVLTAVAIAATTGTSRAGTGVLFEDVKLKAPDAAESDYFGKGVAIYGNTAVIGAPQDDEGATNSGSAYFFERSGGSWGFQSKVTASDAVSKARFGTTAAIWGDWALVGAPREEVSQYGAGAAYMFNRDGNSWVQMQKLVDPSPEINTYFGSALSIHGDYAVVAGDYRHVHVYHRSGDTWNRIAELTPSSPTTSCFGHSVSISDNHVIVGSWNNDPGPGYGTGAAYVFQRTGSTYTQVGKLIASDRQYGDNFGEAVAITDDFAVIGAHKDDDQGVDSGSAYVFRRNGTDWVQISKLLASNGATSDNFGESVSIDGNTIIVGAYDKRTDTDGGVGAAYWYELTDTWNENAFLKPEFPVTGTGYAEYVGWDVSVNGPYAIVSGMYDCQIASVSGAAYIFSVPEPATATLLLLGFSGLLWRRKRR